jgi:hypothetical protein
MTADEHVSDALPELALGLLDGPEEAAALAHVDGCERCRQELDDLLRTADMVLAAVPPAEPPPGFEMAVLARLAATRWLGAVAAALLAIVAIGSVVATRDSGSGTAVASALLVQGDAKLGWAWVLPGDPARVAIDMTYQNGAAAPYDMSAVAVTVQLLGASGVAEEQHVLVLGGSYNGVVRLHGDGAGLTSVRMVGPDGTVLCHGTLS